MMSSTIQSSGLIILYICCSLVYLSVAKLKLKTHYHPVDLPIGFHIESFLLEQKLFQEVIPPTQSVVGILLVASNWGRESARLDWILHNFALEGQL